MLTNLEKNNPLLESSSKIARKEQDPSTEREPGENLKSRVDEIYERRRRELLGGSNHDAPLLQPTRALPREDVIGTASDTNYDIYERRKRELLLDTHDDRARYLRDPLPPLRDPLLYSRDPLYLPRDRPFGMSNSILVYFFRIFL